MACFDVENVFYSYHVSGNSKNIFNSVFVNTNSEIVYQSSDITSSQHVFFSSSVNNCYNIRFSHNLTGCQECIACDGLINQSYCIENKPYTKDEYLKRKQETIHAYLHGGKQLQYDKKNDSCFQCEELENGMFCSYVKTGRNVCFVSRDDTGEKRNLFDTMSSGGQIEGAYGCMGVSPGDNFYCCVNSAFCSHIYYSMFMANCSYCLGCIGLKNKSFCIFNKQYEKEEWHKIANEIFTQMETSGTFGEFFPGSICPFYFNDTAAYLLDLYPDGSGHGFTKEEAINSGYLWRDTEIKVDIPEGVDVVEVNDLDTYEGVDPQGQRTINEDILQKVIRDEKGNYYRIIPMEYKFLKKHGLPLPRLHRLERMKLNFQQTP